MAGAALRCAGAASAGRPGGAGEGGRPPGRARFEGLLAGEHSPGDGRRAGGGPGEDQVTGAGAGQSRSAWRGAPAGGHGDVAWPCPGHRAPTASVDAPICFTYHLPL